MTELIAWSWHKARKFVIERAAGHCELCGTEAAVIPHHKNMHGTKHKGVLAIHNPSNLIGLCGTCHGMAHCESQLPGIIWDFLWHYPGARFWEVVRNCHYQTRYMGQEDGSLLWEPVRRMLAALERQGTIVRFGGGYRCAGDTGAYLWRATCSVAYHCQDYKPGQFRTRWRRLRRLSRSNKAVTWQPYQAPIWMFEQPRLMEVESHAAP